MTEFRYKGMAMSSSSSSSSAAAAAPSSTSVAASRLGSPQTTGFSQIQSRSAAEGGGQAMSVLLSWHEKVIEIAGPGAIIRVMTDRRTV